MHLMQFGEAKGGTWNTLSNFIMNVPDDYKASDIKRELGVVEAQESKEEKSRVKRRFPIVISKRNLKNTEGSEEDEKDSTRASFGAEYLKLQLQKPGTYEF